MRKCKFVILSFVVCIVLVLGGCTKDHAAQEPSSEGKENTQNKSNEESKAEKENQDEADKKEDVAKDEEILITVYYPNDNSDGVEKEEMKCKQLTPENIWALLKSKEVVAENTKVNSLNKEENTLKLDVNTAFGEQLRSYGTAGENMLMQSVVNTFLDAYGCEQIQITEDGSTLVSGHREYADMIHKYK